MFDSKGRNIHYLRLSVTDLCNLRCRYCMPDGVDKLEREDILTYEEFLRLAALFARCGVDTVRVTGGEPLVRKGVEQLVKGLKAIPGIRKVTMTTNAVLLEQQLPALLEAGLDSVNISLDTLDPALFAKITARDAFAAVQAGIHAALESGIPVKLNCVPQVGVNEGELEALAVQREGCVCDAVSVSADARTEIAAVFFIFLHALITEQHIGQRAVLVRDNNGLERCTIGQERHTHIIAVFQRNGDGRALGAQGKLLNGQHKKRPFVKSAVRLSKNTDSS